MGTTGQSITLANSIIGVGILAMPFCFQQCGVVLATLILLFMGLISRLCCYFLLKSALIARRRNFEFLAFHVFGSAGKLLVELGIIGFLMGTCIAYFVVVGDLGPQIISKMFNINQSDILRTSIMVLVSLVCVLPLGLLRNVDSLSNVSAATIGFYFCLVIKVICEAASQLLGGEWHTTLALWRPAGVLRCVPIFSMALFCQTQLFEIFESMPTLSLEKMNVVTKNAINICTAVYFTLGLFGYIAFCSHTISGNILMSLSPTMTSDVIKLGFVMSVAFSFPLIIFPCRASLYSFLFKKVHSSHHDHIINNSIPVSTFRCITVAIIAVTLFISLLIPNIELVLGLVGSTIGVLVCIVFPCACFVNVTFKNTNERLLAKAVLVLGLFIMVLGTFANLEAAEKNHERYDEKYLTQLQIDKMLEDFVQKQGAERKEYEQKEVVTPKIEKRKDEGIINDSEVQPPNPVPPDVPSNEEQQKSDTARNKQKDILPDDKEKQVLTKNKEEQEMAKEKVENQIKQNGINNEIKIVENKENKIEKPKAPAQDNIDMMKQQQLIETIKQHGEEQRELIKEQKEILDKIKQTKNELEQNKKDVGSEEAKKIAVESIKKIANVAIQSLTGVTDKASDNNNNNAENIAINVEDFAKKAVETIQAIDQDNKNKQPVPAPVIIAKNPQNDNIKPMQILQENKQNNPYIQPEHQVADQPTLNLNVPNANAIPNPANIIQNGKVLNQENINNGNNNPNIALGPNEQNINDNIKPAENNKLNGNNIVNNIPISNIPIASQLGQNIPMNEHSHSPDEPQSYKQGEDSQKINEPKVLNSNLIQKVPLPVAMNGNNQIYKNANANKQDSIINDNLKQNGAINNNVRHKREALDCSQVSRLKHEERQICEALSKNSVELTNVDLSSANLPQRIPLDDTIHRLRSLKSFKENDRKR